MSGLNFWWFLPSRLKDLLLKEVDILANMRIKFEVQLYKSPFPCTAGYT